MNKLKVYVAGKFEDAPRVQQVQAALQEADIEISHDWTRQQHKDSVFNAIFDLDGVRNADFLLAVLEEDLAYRGAMAEIGAALVLGIPVYTIGDAKTAKMVFQHHPLYHNWEESSVFLFSLGVVIPERQ